MKKAATIKDVAKTLGISVSTVSRVMNGQDRVSSDMRKRVTETARKLNYVPSHAAVSVVKKQTRILAVLLPDLHTPLYARILDGIEEAARIRGYYPMLVLTRGRQDEEKSFLGSMMGRFVDAVAAIPSSPELSHFTAFPKPTVLIENGGDDDNIDSVSIDNFRGSYLAAEHLLQMGHEKIAIISGDRALSTGHDRFWGFEQALRDKGLAVKPPYTCIGGWTEKNGYAAAFRLLHVEDPPTAIYAAGEHLCRGAIMAAHDLKLRLGRDISLVGFEDSDLARITSPAVTVVNRAAAEMGTIAANILTERLASNAPSTVPQKVSLPPKLIVRDSVRDISGLGL